MEIEHIGIAVKNLEESVKVFNNILDGLNPEFEEVSDQKVRVAIFNVGESRIELLSATSTESPIHKYIEKKGEGIHHIAFKVTGIEQALKRYKDNGILLIDEKPRVGAGGKKIAFLHPKSTNGVLIELTE